MALSKHHGLPCCYCARPMNLHDARMRPTRDHLLPRSQGGREIVVACITCNAIKADMLPDQWAAFMATHPKWWLMTAAERRLSRRTALIVTPGMKLRKAYRQGSPPAPPVIVPPELIFRPPGPLPIEHTKYILTHGTRAYREWEKQGFPGIHLIRALGDAAE